MTIEKFCPSDASFMEPQLDAIPYPVWNCPECPIEPDMTEEEIEQVRAEQE